MSIVQVREALGLTQVDFAILIGVHPLTISKWERKKLMPTQWQMGLIEAFGVASKKPGLNRTTKRDLYALGSTKTIYKLLRACYGSK